MSELDMNLSVNGQSQVPPGFRFHPTEEELLHYYLRKKVAFEKIDLDVIRDVDLNKLEPWDIQEKCKIGSTPQNDWYFFSHKDKKYPTGTRTNRATAAGFWKATGRDKVIYSNFKRIGMRKTLVFYKGRAPHGQKSDWIMHEYRLDDNTQDATTTEASNLAAVDQWSSSTPEDGWVVCRVFKKKNYHKALDSSSSTTSSMDSRAAQMRHLSDDDDGGVLLDEILLYMGSKQEMVITTTTEAIGNISSDNNNMQFLTPMISSDRLHDHRFLHLPRLEETTMHSITTTGSSPLINPDYCAFKAACAQSMDEINQLTAETQPSNMVDDQKHGPSNGWVALDGLVASQLNGQAETSKQFDPNNDFCFSNNIDHDLQLSHLRSNRPNPAAYSSEIDLYWSFARSSSSDPLCHLSV